MRWLLVTLAFTAAFAQYEQPDEGLSKSEKIFGEANEGKAQEHIEDELAGPPEYERGGNSPGRSGEDPYSGYGRAPPAPETSIPGSEPLPPAPASAPGSSEKESGPAAPGEKTEAKKPETGPVESTSVPAQEDKAYRAPLEEKTPTESETTAAEETTVSPSVTAQDKSYETSGPSGESTIAPADSETVGESTVASAAPEATESPIEAQESTESPSDTTEQATESQETVPVEVSPQESVPEQKSEVPSEEVKPVQVPSTSAEYAGQKEASGENTQVPEAGETTVAEETTSVPKETPAASGETTIAGETNTVSVPVEETTVADETTSLPEETSAGTVIGSGESTVATVPEETHVPSGSYESGSAPKSEDTVTPSAEETTVSVLSAPSGSSPPRSEESNTPTVPESSTGVYVTSPVPKSPEGPASGEQASISEGKPKNEGYAASSVQPSSVVPEASPLSDQESPADSSHSGSYQSPTAVTVGETEATTVATESPKEDETTVAAQEAEFHEEQAPEGTGTVEETTVAPVQESMALGEVGPTGPEAKEKAYAAEKSAERTISPVEVALEGSGTSAETVAPSSPTSSETEGSGYEGGSGLSPPSSDLSITEAPVTVAAPGTPTSAEIEAANLAPYSKESAEGNSEGSGSSESTEQPTTAAEGSGYASSEALKSSESEESSAVTTKGYAEKAPEKQSSSEATGGSELPTETAAEATSTEKTEYQQPDKAEGEKSPETVTDIKAGSGNDDETHVEGRSVPQQDSLDYLELEEEEETNPSTPKPTRAPKIDGHVTPSKLMRKLIRMRATRRPLSTTTLESIILHEIDEMTRRRLGQIRESEDEDEEVDKPVLKIQRVGERQGVIVDVVTREPVVFVDGREDMGERLTTNVAPDSDVFSLDTESTETETVLNKESDPELTTVPKDKREEQIVGIAKVETLSVQSDNRTSKRKKLTTSSESAPESHAHQATTSPESTGESQADSEKSTISESTEEPRLNKRKLPVFESLKNGLVETNPLKEESIDYRTEEESTSITARRSRRRKLTTTISPATKLATVVKRRRLTTAASETDLFSLDSESTETNPSLNKESEAELTASSSKQRVNPVPKRTDTTLLLVGPPEEVIVDHQVVTVPEGESASELTTASKVVKMKGRRRTTVAPETDLFSLDTENTGTGTGVNKESSTELTTVPKVVKGKRKRPTTVAAGTLDTESTETEHVPKRESATELTTVAPTPLISTTIEHLSREEKLAARLDPSNILNGLDKSLEDSSLQEISMTESENSTETLEGGRETVPVLLDLTEPEPNLRTKKVKRIHKIKRVRVVHRNRSTTTLPLVPEFRDLPTYSEPKLEEKVIVPKVETTTLWAYATAPGEITLASEASRTESTVTVTPTTVLTLEFAHDTTNSNMPVEPSGYEMGNEPTVITPDLPPTRPEEAVGYDGIPKEEKDSKRELPDQKEISVNSGEVKLLSQEAWMPYRFDCSKEVDEKGSLCKEWAQAGLCEQNRPTAFLFCRKTCLCVGPWARKR